MLCIIVSSIFHVFVYFCVCVQQLSYVVCVFSCYFFTRTRFIFAFASLFTYLSSYVRLIRLLLHALVIPVFTLTVACYYYRPVKRPCYNFTVVTRCYKVRTVCRETSAFDQYSMLITLSSISKSDT